MDRPHIGIRFAGHGLKGQREPPARSACHYRLGRFPKFAGPATPSHATRNRTDAVIPAHPPDEAARLRALRDLDVLDSAPEDRFDRLTRLAQDIFDARSPS